MREYLVKLRNQMNITQQRMSELVCVSRQYYSAIERGARKQDMSMSLIIKFAEIFNVPVRAIIEAENIYQMQEKEKGE